jgi:hypothetical protein
VAAPVVSASRPPALDAARILRPRLSPTSHEPIRPKPIPTVSPGDTIE